MIFLLYSSPLALPDYLVIRGNEWNLNQLPNAAGARGHAIRSSGLISNHLRVELKDPQRASCKGRRHESHSHYASTSLKQGEVQLRWRCSELQQPPIPPAPHSTYTHTHTRSRARPERQRETAQPERHRFRTTEWGMSSTTESGRFSTGTVDRGRFSTAYRAGLAPAPLRVADSAPRTANVFSTVKCPAVLCPTTQQSLSTSRL